MSLTSGHRLGPYEILTPLGAGGMGEVYRGRDSRLDREVAIKVLPADRMADPARRWAFVQEAKAASALNHPHIVTIHEIESVITRLTSEHDTGAGSFSPDGTQIAYASTGEDGTNWDIRTRILGAPEVRRLTTDPASEQFPAWSPRRHTDRVCALRAGGVVWGSPGRSTPLRCT
ncbi:Serine/threonine-protein kinase PknF [Luteitalea pratensis]|uniref:Serine/threonine-protein kinase PknF n=1 Tax=Luteitalea pratensis TaxID=1855912 RepID=A0A143PME5_LUTPR|nr:protein kinase [Luteitalea pratensis]AMY09383.1 Serine/threonine-protein kinase PknF [Luteitalea pratensis]